METGGEMGYVVGMFSRDVFRGRMFRFSLLFLLAAAVAACFPLAAAPVAVVSGFESVSAGEARFAASLAGHVERWYREAGAPVLRADDRSLGAALAGAKVAVLVHPGNPPRRLLDELGGFVGRGGKLIVCYSSSPGLAALMGVKLGGYLKAPAGGSWSQMRFCEGRPRGAPAAVLQTSSNLFSARPVPGRSRVLAWWHDRQGRRTEEPAWLASRAGCWMTHVLQADGDAEAKGRLLLALAAQYDASLWPLAAESALRRARGLERRVGAAVRVSGRAARAGAAWGALEGVVRSAEGKLRAGDAFGAWEAARDARARCQEVYGLLQGPRRGEIRAVWDHSGQGLYPGDWARTCRLLKDAGLSDLFVNVAGAGFAHYASDVLPRSRVFDEQGDQLAACAAAAKAAGLRVHAWLLCFTTERSTAERVAVFRRRGWLLDDDAARPWLDPSVPEVRERLTAAAREMAVKYRVDGVHLDFARYPDFRTCFGAAARRRFERDEGVRAAAWPEDVKSGALRARFIRWRAKQVTDFVQETRRALRRDAPGKMLTAAVYGKYPSCLDAVGQDWESWLNIGLLDYAAPMDYTEDPAKFEGWLSRQGRTRALAMRVLPGIGVTAAESRLDAMGVIDQISAVRRAGFPGFALFDLDTTLRQEILPVLRMGMTAPQ